MARTALVTGATGFIGQHLAAALQQRHERVVAAGRTRPEPDRVGAFRALDLAEPTDLDAVVDGIDVLYHLAGASSSIAGPEEMERVNVHGTRELLRAALAAGVQRVVLMSTSSVYGKSEPLPQPVVEDADCHPGAGYAETKWRGEQAAFELVADGLAVTVLRPVTVYGPGAVKLLASTILDAAVERYAGAPAFAVPRGPVELRVVHVRDVVDACLLLAEHDDAVGRVFNLSSGVYPSSHEVAGSVADALGTAVELTDEAEPGLDYDDRLAAWERMRADGMHDGIMLRKERIRFLRKANRNNRLSLEALAGLGFRPAHTDTDAGVRASVAWYREHRWLL